MASITAVTATPTSVAKGGASRVVPSITNTDRTATVTVRVDGSTGTGQVTIHELLTWSANPADWAKSDPASPTYVPGLVCAIVDQGGAMSMGADGVSFTFTAS